MRYGQREIISLLEFNLLQLSFLLVVGVSLKFNFELLGKKWEHKGFSSKGNPVHEIWSKRDN
jgi:hypothetical protein